MKIDARGDACPIPVIKTKKAVRLLQSESKTERVTVLVDNKIATENLTKMCNEMGLNCATQALGEREYSVDIDVVTRGVEPVPEPSATAAERHGGLLVVVSSEVMGGGNDELGAALMKAFIFALTESDSLPGEVLFYNGGAKLTAEGSPVLDDLKALEEAGVQIATCGACLNFYGLTEKLRVGNVTNMYSILEKMSGAERIIKP